MKIMIKKSDLSFKNITAKVVSYTLFLKLVIILLIILNFNYSKKILVIDKEIRLSIQEKEKFNEDNLKEYLMELNIKFPDVVLAQSKLETANFTSKRFKENNNLFGMKQSTSRPTTSKKVEGGYAYYSNWRECVVDYAFYQAKYLSDLSKEEYVEYLSKNYAEDPKYKDKLLNMVKNSD